MSFFLTFRAERGSPSPMMMLEVGIPRLILGRFASSIRSE